MDGPDTSPAPTPPPPPPPAPAAAGRQSLASRRLHGFGCFALAAFVGWQLYRSQLEDPLLLALGCAMIVLAALPALRWARLAEKHLPAFEVLCLTVIPFYALPLFRQHGAERLFDPEILLHAALGVLLFLATANVAHRYTRFRPITHPLWQAPLLRPGRSQLPLLGIYLNVVFLYTLNYTDLIPWEFAGLLRALFFGTGIASTYIAASMWGRHELSVGERGGVALGLFLQFVFTASGLYLISATSLLLLAIIGYVSESRRIPIAAVVSLFLLIAVLHNGKGEMRRIYWFEGERRAGLTELPGFFQEWIGHGLQFSRETDRPVSTGILERTSLFHIMCVVMDRSPSLTPHLGGETYKSIPLILIPRFIWADKPAPHDSNRTLAIAYGFSTEDSARNVSIAFGTPAEAYANFGFLGLALAGAFYGWFFRKVAGWSEGAPAISFAGLSMILLVAWSFQAEMTLAVWLSSLFQAMIALVALPMALKVAFNR